MFEWERTEKRRLTAALLSPTGTEDDDVFIDLIDSPKLTQLLSQIVGNGGLEEGEVAGGGGTARFFLISGRVVPPGGNAHGYVQWHKDTPRPEQWPRPSQRYVKAFTYIFDCQLSGGESGLVPGSHRLPDGPEQTLDVHYRSGRSVGFDDYDQPYDDPSMCVYA